MIFLSVPVSANRLPYVSESLALYVSFAHIITRGTHVWLRWSKIEKMFRLVSDWHKMRRGGAYTIPFPAEPKYDALKYEFFDTQGQVTGTFTAAEVLTWHTATLQSGEDMLAPTGRRTVTRLQFQNWLRESFRQMLGAHDVETKALIDMITPHSFRAGLAGDM